ncbi:hypothetical protein WOLCODRAFT_129036 [Wolfiporia cocos MD-104 SS10]|uniref:Uncharacterized protein n=1 Tax=Wolfiporia cocos (strain MD-104) TaxID=742152 RepID=A0A2H3JA19_WOLCO|nr:hypothetical protein WOLCODRAFT_129036 [Wolfiporia cocos MD-104 SS10]
MFVYFILSIVSLNSGPLRVSYIIYQTTDSIVVVLYVIWAVFSALRIYAINGRGWRMPLTVLTLGLVPAVTNIYCFAKMTMISLPPPLVCTIASNEPDSLSNRLVALTRACVIACDAVVLLATWYTTVGIRRLARIAQVEVSLSALLLRDGTIYFVVLFVLNVLDIVLWLTRVFENLTVYNEVFTTILLSRFFLNLRQAPTASSDEPSLVSQISDPNFVTSKLIGPMDAPLDLLSTMETWHASELLSEDLTSLPDDLIHTDVGEGVDTSLWETAPLCSVDLH